MQSKNDFSFYYYLKLLLLFIYLAAPGLSDSTQNLQSSLWHAESLVAACGICFLDQGSSLGLLHWDVRVLITGHQRDPSLLFLAAWALARQNIIIQCHGSSFPLRLSATPIIRAFRSLVPSHPPTLPPASSTCPSQLSEHAGTPTSLNMLCSLAYDILVVSNTLFLCLENSSLGLKVQLKEAPSPCNLL